MKLKEKMAMEFADRNKPDESDRSQAYYLSGNDHIFDSHDSDIVHDAYLAGFEAAKRLMQDKITTELLGKWTPIETAPQEFIVNPKPYIAMVGEEEVE